MHLADDVDGYRGVLGFIDITCLASTSWLEPMGREPSLWHWADLYKSLQGSHVYVFCLISYCKLYHVCQSYKNSMETVQELWQTDSATTWKESNYEQVLQEDQNHDAVTGSLRRLLGPLPARRDFWHLISGRQHRYSYSQEVPVSTGTGKLRTELDYIRTEKRRFQKSLHLSAPLWYRSYWRQFSILQLKYTCLMMFVHNLNMYVYWSLCMLPLWHTFFIDACAPTKSICSTMSLHR